MQFTGVTAHDLEDLEVLDFKQLDCWYCFGHQHAKHQCGLKLNCVFSKLQIPPFLKRTLIPTRSTHQSPGGSVEHSLLLRIMGFPSALGHQMLYQNGRHVSSSLQQGEPAQ